MTQVVMSIPTSEVNFLTTLAKKMGWQFRTKEYALDKFIESSPADCDILSDEDIQNEVNAVRHSK